MRSFGVLNCHSDHAFFAASTAFSTSSAVPRGTSAMTSPVAGFKTSIVSPLDDSTHSPPMNCFSWVTDTLTGTSVRRLSVERTTVTARFARHLRPHSCRTALP